VALVSRCGSRSTPENTAPRSRFVYPAISLLDVVVTDDAGTPDDASDDQSFPVGRLAAQECATYSGSYQPSSVNSTDTGLATFSDTVTVTGSAVLGFGDAQDSSMANCDLCC